MVGFEPVPVIEYVFPDWDVIFTYFTFDPKSILSVMFEISCRVSPLATEPLANASVIVAYCPPDPIVHVAENAKTGSRISPIATKQHFNFPLKIDRLVLRLSGTSLIFLIITLPSRIFSRLKISGVHASRASP